MATKKFSAATSKTAADFTDPTIVYLMGVEMSGTPAPFKATAFDVVREGLTVAWSGTGVATTPLLVNVTADPGPAAAASKLLDLQVGGSSKVNATKAGDFLARTFTGGETTARSWSMGTRDAVTTIPVPYIRPTSANSAIAVDIMPNGTASDFAGNGFAWIDVCDTDCATGNPPVVAARLGITASTVEVGSRSFNGATPKSVAIAIDGTAKMTFNPANNWSYVPLVCENAGIFLRTNSSPRIAFGTADDVTLVRKSSGILTIGTGNDGSTGGGALEFTEMTAPATPAANQARIFARDNGSGKTQVCVILPDGVVTVLATQT